ncbi:MAG: putative baseplate assembly protein [Cyanobacteria bacterium P01_H01_bin.150]
MKFDFLPNLEKPNLDDRKFKDLVEECILRIPRYCPEWTNHNPGDPGITLIELFAWLTDQMLLRFNQVPLLNYITFLELLGIRLQAPKPAKCNLTFYLSKEQPEPVEIPLGTEVATVRTENEKAVIFTTDEKFVIGNPRIKHFLTATITENRPEYFDTEVDGAFNRWERDELLLFERCQPRNCFYLVLDEVESNFAEDEERENTISGNVIAINFKGDAARTTGIIPDNPPLKWEAWNGKKWLELELEEDKTKGFSFHDVTQSLEHGADIILRLPQKLPSHQFGNYNGYWIRCEYTEPNDKQEYYFESPTVIGISIRAIGGTTNATQCVRMENEVLGISNGKPGQIFELQSKPILDRNKEQKEYIEILLPGGEIKTWEEVKDFGKSDDNTKHYTIDSVTGTVQFGPLVREASQLRELTLERREYQRHRPNSAIIHRDKDDYRQRNLSYIQPESDTLQTLERQYGAVPPPGAEIFMRAYRTGGGSEGNVKEKTLTVLKHAIPYVKSVTNYQEATGGKDSESLEQAVIRVPEILRTRECAVIPEDFERITRQAKISRDIARAHCAKNNTPGLVRLLVVPKPNNFQSNTDDFCGTNPDKDLDISQLKEELGEYIENRKPLGVQVKFDQPCYVGVKVALEVLLAKNIRRNQEEIRNHIKAFLYRFLNPFLGGLDGKGWELGRKLHASEIVAVCQKIPEVQYVGNVLLFEIQKCSGTWICEEEHNPEIDPGSEGIIFSCEQLCSPSEEEQDFGHVVEFLEY